VPSYKQIYLFFLTNLTFKHYPKYKSFTVTLLIKNNNISTDILFCDSKTARSIVPLYCATLVF